MKPPVAALLALSAACALAGCGAMAPPRNAALDEARAAVAGVAATADLAPEARAELRRATEALRAAEAASADGQGGPAVEHLAYLARQRALLARERDALKRTERRIDAAAAEQRDRLIEARDRALEAQQRAEARAAAAQARAARVQQQMQPGGATERMLSDAERGALVAAARRAAADEREEQAMRARAADKLARRQKPPRKSGDATARSARPQVASADKSAVEKAAAEKSAAERSEAAKPKAPPGATATSVDRDNAREVATAAPPDPRATADTGSRPAGAPATPPIGSVVTLNDESFHPGAPYLRPGATRALDPIADYLRAHPERKVRISGSAPGSDRELSGGRANEVRAALLRRGVAADRVQVVAGSGTEDRGGARVDIVIADERGRTAAR